MYKKNFDMLCKAKGVSASAVMKAIGRSHVSYQKWTDNTVPHAATQKLIAEYFNVPQDWFLEEHNSEAAPIAPPESEFKLPVYGAISAGRGVLAQEDIIDYEYTDARYNDGAHVWLEVRGISMEPELHSGDRVLIRRQPDLECGQLGAFIVGDEGYIKRYRPEDDGIHLVSMNPIYPDMVFAGDAINSLTIFGKVIEARHKY